MIRYAVFLAIAIAAMSCGPGGGPEEPAPRCTKPVDQPCN